MDSIYPSMLQTFITRHVTRGGRPSNHVINSTQHFVSEHPQFDGETYMACSPGKLFRRENVLVLIPMLLVLKLYTKKRNPYITSELQGARVITGADFAMHVLHRPVWDPTCSTIVPTILCILGRRTNRMQLPPYEFDSNSQSVLLHAMHGFAMLPNS